MAIAVLITGRPGSGKTTLMQRVIARLPGRAAGFYTRELRKGGARTGFELVTLKGERGVLASIERSGGPRVGKYGVDLAVLDEVGVPALRQAMREADYVVVDEIGKMELLSPAFVAVVRDILAGPYRLLGAIMQQPHPVADEIKQMPGVRVIEVTPANRDRLVEEVVAMLVERG